MFGLQRFVFILILLSGSHCSSLNRFVRQISSLANAADGTCQQAGYFCDCTNLSVVYYCMDSPQGLQKLEVRICTDGKTCSEALRECGTLKNEKCDSNICQGEMYYPDEEDCFFYFDCRAGTPNRIECPVGTIFSKTEKKCVVGTSCDDDVTEPPTTTTESTTTTTESSTIECTGSRFLPDPDSCLYYFDCITNSPVRRKCPKI